MHKSFQTGLMEYGMMTAQKSKIEEAPQQQETAKEDQ
jgi:hypothetical protein